MANEKQNLKKIFLSASIPDQTEKEYLATVDRTNIRDAIKALASVIISKAHLVYGGQPVITRLIHEVISTQNSEASKSIILYQSEYFEDLFPEENHLFLNKIFTPKLESKAESLQLMRKSMIKEHDYYAGIFIGGMKGVLKEYELFSEMHPNAKVLPIANTGGAANIIFSEHESSFYSGLKTELGYMALFRMLLKL